MKIEREKNSVDYQMWNLYASEKKNFPLKYYNYSKEYILNQVDESLKI